MRTRDIAALCRGIYAYPGDPPVTWDHYDDGPVDGVRWAVKSVGNTDVVIFEGTYDDFGWILNIMAVANPWSQDALGPIHPGFFVGIEQVWRELRPMLSRSRPVIIGGHSRGAAQAADLTGLMVADGFPPCARVVFGEPLAGFQKLADIVATVPGWSYCNGSKTEHKHDPVCDVPFSIPVIQPYARPTPLIDVSEEPEANDPWGSSAWHRIQLYESALGADSPIIN